MKIEKIGETNKYKWIIIGFIICASLFVLINYLVTKAKYRNTESLDLVKGTINYNKADLNIIAMYQEKDDSISLEKEYININKIPTVGYKLSEDSYCEVNGEPIEEIEIEYLNSEINISHLTEKGTKCYIYFDSLVKEMLGKLETSKQSKYTIDAMPNPITGPYDETTENPNNLEKLYTSPDNYGTSYVFRGNNNDVNNWVTFANHTWRIIRINGDGTLRLIYQCDTPGCTDTTGEKTNAFSSAYKTEPVNDNTYVGYYYGTAKTEEKPNPKYEETHSNSTPSTIAQAIDNWYNGTGTMSDYTKYLSGSTGFCNDRMVVKKVYAGFEGDGTGNNATGYGPAARLIYGGNYRTTQYPTLKCGVDIQGENQESYNDFRINEIAVKRDLFTTAGSNNGNEKLSVPAALITSDELVMVGEAISVKEKHSWLYTNQVYCTMSPVRYDINDNTSVIFRMVVDDYGFGGGNVVWTYGVRPVINLRTDIEFTQGTGAPSNPFIVKTNN